MNLIPNRAGLLLALMTGFASFPSSAQEGLSWPTGSGQGQILLMRTYGLPRGSVVNTTRGFEQWGKSSTVTWQYANNIAGEYIPTLTYRSGQDVRYTLTIGDVTHEGTMEKGEGTLKQPIPAVMLNRIGVVPITLSVSADDAENDFALTDFRLRHVPGDISMSKPVLIAGGDWMKFQGSLEILSEEINPEMVTVHAAITSWPEGEMLWEGTLPTETVAAGLELDHTVAGLEPERWSPTDPNLYTVALEVRAGGDAPVIQSVSRMGFRDFEAKNGRFYLNGTPIFLRGKSIMPPGGADTRDLNPVVANDPASIREYLLRMKSFNVNLVRTHDPLWLSICDEVGMMVFTGRYGVPKWGGASRGKAPVFEEDAVRYYKHHFAEAYMNHPSVVIWVLTNEMPSALSTVGSDYIVFLRQVFERMSVWDPTRAYIENAGFGLGQGGNVNDFHVYVGWYNGIVQSLYKFRYDLRKLAGIPSPLQPMAFTEIIGVYIDPQGRLPATGKMVSASLTWGGNEVDVPDYAMGYQNYMTGQFLEITRRLRAINPTIAGLMPFTTTARAWQEVQSVDEIQFLPFLTEAFVKSYQPVLLSFENWRPHVYAGESIELTVHLVNDAEDARDLTNPVLQWRLVRKDSGREIQSGSLPLAEKLYYYDVVSRELPLTLGAELEKGAYVLHGDVFENGKIISSNDTAIWVEPRTFPALKTYRKVTLYDPMNETRPLLEKAGLVEGRDFFMTTSPFAGMRQFDQLSGSQYQETLGVEDINGDTLVAPSRSVMIVGTTQWVEPLRDKYQLMNEFILRGGRVVFLHPTAPALNDTGIYRELMVMENKWVGDRASVDLESLWHTSRYFGAWINPRRSDNKIFDGIDREQLWLWSDSSGWDQTKPGLPEFEPVNTFLKLRNAEALASTAILANFGRGLEHVALAEVFRGEGSVILSGFDFPRFGGFDPIADKVLRGIISYAADDQKHEIVPKAKRTVNLGSPSDEAGLIPSEFRNGLLLEYHTGYQVRRIAGPFWFNRLCHTKLLNPENPQREGFMHLRPPEGSTEVVFQVRRVVTGKNKGRFEPETLTISIGDQVTKTLISGEEVEVRVPLPAESQGPVKVVFQGLDDMGLSTMTFE